MVFRYDENPLWFDLFTSTFQSLKPSINYYIKRLNLTHVYCFKTVQNDIYIIIYGFYVDEKLLYLCDENLFVYIKCDGTRNLIHSFKPWLRTLSFNHIKQIRKQRNSIESDLNIDDFKIMCKQSAMSFLESKELCDKIEQLEDDVDSKILELHYLERRTYKEIATILHQKGYGYFRVSTLRKKKERALDKLRDIY